MAPYVADNQGFSEHYVKSSDMLGLSKDSHCLAKNTGAVRREWPQSQPIMQAPTIRVIHIFAPKVIKTDVANFRSTVQRLTGKTKKTSSGSHRRARTKTVGNPCNTSEGSYCSLLSPHSSQKEIRQGLEVTSPDLVRCNSMDSNYSFSNSMDSNNFSCDSYTSNDTDLPSPTGGGFSFYPHRQAPYSLNEIPAPFLAGDVHPSDIMAPRLLSQTTLASTSSGIRDTSLPLPSVMDNSVLGFSDMDILSGLGSALPVPDFPVLPPLGSSSGLWEMFMPTPPLCRLSVPSPFHGTTSFEF